MSTSLPHHPKILFIGSDSAEPELLEKWCDDGTLPNLKALRDRSAWGETRYPTFLGSGAMWPSVFTGVTPAMHGRYFITQIKPNSYERYYFKPEYLQTAPFWRAFSEAGKRVAIIDVPQCPLDPEINGVHIVDWLTHDKHYKDPQVVPASLFQDMEDTYGFDIGGCDRHDGTAQGLTELRDKIADRVRRKTALTTKLLDQEDWDLFCVVYHDPHCIGHQCWHVRDPNHPKHDPALAQAIGDPVKDIYIEMDKAIGELMERAGPDTYVMFFNGPGMGPNYTGNHLLDDILTRLQPVRGAVGRPAVNALKKIWSYLPGTIRTPLRKRAHRVEQGLMGPEWAKRSYYQVPHNDLSGAIRINLEGREPNGRVKPGHDFDEVAAQLKEELLEVKNLETGEPLVRDVCLASDYLGNTGPHLEELPDIFVEWNRSAPITVVGSEKTGTIRHSFGGVRTGDHTPHTVLFAAGPGVSPGKLSEPVDLLAISCCLAKLLGVPFEQAQASADKRLATRASASAA